MSEDGLVSIICPCYNVERYIDRFLKSILLQDHHTIELILINDGSSDHTEKIVFSYMQEFKDKGIKFIYRYQNNLGQAAAVNYGLKLVSGQYIALLDSDDEISESYISSKVRYLEENPEKAYCYGNVEIYKESDPSYVIQRIGRRNKCETRTFFEDILYVRNVFFPGYLVREACLRYLLPDLDIYTGAGGQNAQILLPLAWKYGEPEYVDGGIYKYYIHSDSHSHSINTGAKIIKQWENYEKILINTILRINDDSVKKYIKPLKQHYARVRFGNAVDTKNPKLIRECFLCLVRRNTVRPHDIALLLKYGLISWCRG